MLGFLGLPSGSEWLVVLLVALLLFGSRLPSIMRSLGRSVTEFKKGMREGEEEDEGASRDDAQRPAGGNPSAPAG